MREHLLSERARNVERSVIREILKLTKRPEVISFAGGVPNPNTFPKEGLAQAAMAEIRENYSNCLQYGVTEGVEELREEMIRWLEGFGFQLKTEETMVTSASQQALDLVGKTFINRGDGIFLGAPTYLGGIQAFSVFRPDFIGTPVAADGLDIAVLREKIEERKEADLPCKLIYVVPDFQNPSGVTLSEAKRKEIVAVAEEYDLLVVEDAPYFALRYEDEPINPLGSFDENGRVISVFSLSKVLSSGMRLAVAVGPAELIGELVKVKQPTDLCTPPFTQWIAARWLAENDLNEQIERVRNTYKVGRDAILEALERHFPQEKGVEWTKPKGGLFVWVRLPEGIDAEELFYQAVEEENVAFVPGEQFFVTEEGKNTMRLSFSLPGAEEIEEGIKRLSKVVRRRLSLKV